MALANVMLARLLARHGHIAQPVSPPGAHPRSDIGTLLLSTTLVLHIASRFSTRKLFNRDSPRGWFQRRVEALYLECPLFSSTGEEQNGIGREKQDSTSGGRYITGRPKGGDSYTIGVIGSYFCLRIDLTQVFTNAKNRFPTG